MKSHPSFAVAPHALHHAPHAGRHHRHGVNHWPVTIFVIAASLGLGYWQNGKSARVTAKEQLAAAAVEPPAREQPHVAAASPVDAGRYLVRVGGCNDCHTAGFAAKGGEIPEAEWLTGDDVGFRGPWGTTYATNLRLYVKDMPEEVFVQAMRQRNSRPPMPWPSLHAMSDADLRALYTYIKTLGPAGKPTPQYVPPGTAPTTPVVDFVPTMPQAKP